MGACVEGSILFEGAQVGEGTVARNLIVGLGAIIHGGCIVRGLFVLGVGVLSRRGTYWIRVLEPLELGYLR